LVAAVVVAALVLVGCSSGAADPPRGDSTSTTTTSAPVGAGAAVTVLDGLAVKGRAPKTGYDRDEFGPSWSDVDRNGCDTRNDMLNRDLTDKQWRPNTHDCVVVMGTLVDPYTGRTLQFAKAHAIAVQIDHVVALSDAWQKGAQQLSPGERLAFANDPVNLLAVDGPTNGSKGDSDAASWLPPNRSFRCTYAARQIAVKARYRLWVTRAERDALLRILARCPDEPLPR
jgi:hypothetical protein